jgi:hypothetical protein
MRYKDVLSEQRKAIKEILTEIEIIDMNPEQYHVIRSKVKSKMFRVSNCWLQFLAAVVDAKFYKKVNEDGEKEETHLKDGEN